MVEIGNAAGLAAAGVLAVVAGVLFSARRKNSRRWRMACVGLPAGAAVLAALALAGLAVLANPAAKRVVILLDVSPSTRGSELRNPGWLRGLAAKRLGDSVRVTVVGFGGAAAPRVLLKDVPVSEDWRWPLEWSGADMARGVGSDVGAALAWRSGGELDGGRALAPRWVVTDGYVQNVGAPSGEASAGGTRSGGIPSEITAVGFELGWTAVVPREVDLGVMEIEARAARGGGAEILARVAATGKADGELRFLRDGSLLAERRIVFSQAGSRWVSLADVGAKAGHRYAVTITRTSAGGGDRWPENDRGTCEFRPAKEAARILVVGQAVAGLEGFDVTRIGAEFFPSEAGELCGGRWQAIVLNDLALLPGAGESEKEILPGYAPGMLSAFVRDTGGGLLILGRKHAFGPGGYAEMGTGPESLEGLSPVWSERRNRPAARVRFSLDASGSMNEAVGSPAPERKFRLAARAVEETLGLLLEQDRIAVVTFNDHAAVMADASKAELLEKSGGETLLRKKLDGVQPTGSTVPDAALADVERLAGAKDAERPEIKILVLLTDGEIPAMSFAGWNSMLAKTGCGLTVVAPPPEAGSALEKIARQNHAMWLTAQDPAAWAALLKRAVAERLTGKARDKALAWHTTDFPPTELRGMAAESIEVWKKDEARELAAADDAKRSQVLVAVAQRGLGRVAALAMGPGTDAVGYDALLERVVREIEAPPGDRRFTITARRSGEWWVVRAEGIEGGKFLDGMALRLENFGEGDSQLQETAMRQVGAGEYEASVAASGPLWGMVVRSTGSAKMMVGTVRSGDVATAEWPASYDGAPVVAPAGAVVLGAEEKGAGEWMPRVREWRWDLSPMFWLGAAAAAVGALWLRRQ